MRRILRGAILGQVFVATVLMLAAAWLRGSLESQRNGVEAILARHYVLISLDGRTGGYDYGEVASGLKEISRRLRESALVRTVEYSRVPVLQRASWSHYGRTEVGAEQRLAYNVVSDGYLQSGRARLAAGRWINDRDVHGSPLVALVTESMARRLWGSRNALGEVVHLRGEAGARVIVGIVTDPTPGQGQAAEMYLPYHQAHPVPLEAITLRIEPAENELVDASRTAAEVVQTVLPEIGAVSPVSAEEQFRQANSAIAMLLGLANGFSLVALVLVVVGVHSAVAFTAARRRREWAVRAAVGASPRAIMWLTVREAVVASLISATMGVGMVLVIRRLIFSQSTSASHSGIDAYSLLGIAVVMAAVVLAVAIPAYRTVCDAPGTVLRNT